MSGMMWEVLQVAFKMLAVNEKEIGVSGGLAASKVSLSTPINNA
jgi:hypothetical protein